MEYSDTGPAPTLQDKAIDTFGVSIGLVRFSGTQSRCGPTTSNAVNASEHAPEDDTGNEDADDSDETDTDNLNEIYWRPGDIATSKGKPVLESHPYIVSQWVASSNYRVDFHQLHFLHLAHLSVPWT